jgi:hypothetical protein
VFLRVSLHWRHFIFDIAILNNLEISPVLLVCLSGMCEIAFLMASVSGVPSNRARIAASTLGLVKLGPVRRPDGPRGLVDFVAQPVED